MKGGNYMSAERFLIIYLIMIMLMAVFEIFLLTNNKGQHLKTSYKSLKGICENITKGNEVNKEEVLATEITRFYNEYIQEEPQIKKFFPNVVVWVDAIIFRVDCGYKSASVLNDYKVILKKSRDILEKRNPFNKCEKYQQGILCDMNKIKTSENELVVQNIIGRTEEEFLRLSGDVRKNNTLNLVSIAVGIIGIVVSILMAFMNF